MANKTPDEKFNEEVWYVLQRVKELSLKASSDTPIEYEIKKITASGIPSRRSQSQIIEKLQEWKAIEIVEHTKPDWRYNNPEKFLIEILEPKFSKTYKKYDPDNTTLTLDQKVAQSETKESVEILIVDLESKYDEILETKADDKFFIKLANYGKLLTKNKLLSSLLSNLRQNADEDLKKYKSEREKFLKKLKPLAQDICEKAKTAKIKDHPENPLTSQIQFLKENIKDTDSSHFDNKGVDYFYNPYRELVDRFIKKGKSNLIKEKHLGSDGKTLILYPNYVSVQNEWEKFKKVRDSSVWWAHYNIIRIAVGLLDLENKEKYFPKDDVVSDIYKNDFNSIIKGQKAIYLKREKAETWLKRLHNYIKPRLKFYPLMVQISKDYSETFIKTIKELKKNVDFAKTAVDNVKEIEKRIADITQKAAKSIQAPTDITKKIQADLTKYLNAFSQNKVHPALQQKNTTIIPSPVNLDTSVPRVNVSTNRERIVEEKIYKKIYKQLVKLNENISTNKANNVLTKKDQPNRQTNILNNNWNLEKINNQLREMNWPINVEKDLNKRKYNLYHNKRLICSFEIGQNLGEVMMIFLANANNFIDYPEIYKVTTYSREKTYKEAIKDSKSKIHKKLRQIWYDIMDKKLEGELKTKFRFEPEGRSGKFKLTFIK